MAILHKPLTLAQACNMWKLCTAEQPREPPAMAAVEEQLEAEAAEADQRSVCRQS